MKPVPRLTQNFLDMLEAKIRGGSGPTLIFKQMDTMFNMAEDSRDIKLILLKYLDDDRVKDKLRTHVKTKYPHLLETLDKMLILK